LLPLFFDTCVYLSKGNGDVQTFGILGRQSITGIIEGGFRNTLFGVFEEKLAVVGFTGFHIAGNDYYSTFGTYIGSALAVRINQNNSLS
jgi:hypothetical protein